MWQGIIDPTNGEFTGAPYALAVPGRLGDVEFRDVEFPLVARVPAEMLSDPSHG